MSKPVGYLVHQLLTSLNINHMLRVFITAILYLISFFTQGQKNSHFEQNEGDVQKFSIEVKVNQINDDNGKLDFSLNGMPLEDYGSSNNVMTFGPPNFEDSKFEVMDKDLTFEIKL
jgi:hypothetical protein